MNTKKIESIPASLAWLQFHAQRIDENNVQVDYELVIPLGEFDCRGTFNHKAAKHRPVSWRLTWLDANNCKRVPLGRCLVGTSNPDYPFWAKPTVDDGALKINTPFRDGAHMQWDAEKLGGKIKTYYVAFDGIYEISKEETT